MFAQVSEVVVNITVDRQETLWRFDLEGDFNVTSVAELRAQLIGGIESGKQLHLDLSRTTDSDIASLQLLVAAARHGLRIVGEVPETAALAARDAGLEPFPGTSESGAERG